MTAFARRTARTWAVLDAIYGAALAGLFAAAVPWKTPWVNALGIVFGLAVIADAPGLWQGRRWGFRLALATAVAGLACGAAAVAALLGSFGYLRAIYGGAGAGAGVVIVLLCLVVFQWLGLYSALKLRALLRQEVRSEFSRGGGRALSSIAAALALLPIGAVVGVDLRYRLAPVDEVPAAARGEALALLRTALDGHALEATPALEDVPLGAGPLAVTVWEGGRPRARLEVQGADLAAAIRSAAEELAARGRGDAGLRQGRIKIDRTVARGPVLSSTAGLLGMSLDPGLDGLAASDGRPYFWPDDLLRGAAFGAAPLLASIPELRLGVSAHWLRGQLGGGMPGGLQRFRTESWIETPSGAAGVHRGRVEGAAPPLGDAAAAAAAFLLRQAEPDGRFLYRYDPYDDRSLGAATYNIPRHAGTIYSLALLYERGRDPRIAAAAEAGIAYLAALVPPTCGDAARACVVEGGRAALGANALAAVALFEHQRRTGKTEHAALARRLAAFLLSAQKPDGTFHYLFDSGAGAFVPSPPRLYAAEEAAFALALAHEVLGDARYLAAAERALDHLTGRKYDSFIGGFVYGADAWTCIAAEEVWPHLRHRRYLDFCRGYSGFLRRLQYQPEPGASSRDFAGHYGFSLFAVPQAAATAGLTEGVLSAYALSRAHGAPDEALRAQAELSLGALARDQIGAANGYLARDPARAAGAIRRSLAEPEVRIDFVQHAAAAFVRGEALGLSGR